MTSIKSVGASFVEDDVPHHAATLETELPRTSANAAGDQTASLGPAEACEAELRHDQPVWQISLKLGEEMMGNYSTATDRNGSMSYRETSTELPGTLPSVDLKDTYTTGSHGKVHVGDSVLASENDCVVLQRFVWILQADVRKNLKMDRETNTDFSEDLVLDDYLVIIAVMLKFLLLFCKGQQSTAVNKREEKRREEKRREEKRREEKRREEKRREEKRREEKRREEKRREEKRREEKRREEKRREEKRREEKRREEKKRMGLLTMQVDLMFYLNLLKCKYLTAVLPMGIDLILSKHVKSDVGNNGFVKIGHIYLGHFTTLLYIEFQKCS
ncbi:hypothetical protein Q9966_014725 [Columba livia]|nr:hypothetical protein Q9966_014725 [Columba livia]